MDKELKINMGAIKKYMTWAGLIVAAAFLVSVTINITNWIFAKPLRVIHYICVEHEGMDFECRDTVDGELLKYGTELRSKRANGGF